MKTHIFLLLWCLAPLSIFAQYNYGFQQEYFFGRLPSGQIEAMGRANVAVGGSVASLFFNPAGIGLIDQQEATFSTSAPFYFLKGADYYFVGAARRFKPNMVGALTVNKFAIGPTTFDLTILGIRYPTDKPRSTNIALSYAIEPIEGLHIGTNVNTFLWKYIDEVPVTAGLHIDLGALYRMPLNEGEDRSSHLQFGAAVNNLTFAGISFANPQGEKDFADFPAIMRAGVAFMANGPVDVGFLGLEKIGFTGTLEYQNVLNDFFRRGIRIGTETILWDVFAVRLGYLSHSLNDGGLSSNRDRMRDLTFGFGLIIPLQSLTNGKVPFNMNVDYVSLKQPPQTDAFGRLENFRTFSFRFVWVVE
jgi:hypothetical protein